LVSPIQVYDRNEIVEGATYSDWTVNYWQWLVSMEKEENPLLDMDGKSTSEKQTGPVFFCAGVPPDSRGIHRRYAVPSKKAILIPLNVSLATNLQHPNKNLPELRMMADIQESQVTDINVKCADKILVEDWENLRVTSPVFDIYLRSNNILGIDVDNDQMVSCKAVSDGYWLILKPLKDGSYEVRIDVRGSYMDFQQEENKDFVTGVAHHFTIYSLPDVRKLRSKGQ
jgi:hypothetical protein